MILSLLLSAQSVLAAPEWLPPTYSAESEGQPREESWWESLGSEELNRAVERSLEANPDLAALDALVSQSRALSNQARAALLPQLSLDSSAQLASCAALGAFGPCTVDFTGSVEEPDSYLQGRVGFQASMLVDLFGVQLNQWQASRHDARATEWERERTTLMTEAQVVLTWLDMVSVSRQLTLLEEQLDTNRALLEVVRIRYEGGSASALDLLQQEQQLASLEAQVPLTRAALLTQQQRMATLQARDPVRDLPDTSEALPPLPPRPALGLPKELLLTRGDLLAASERSEAATRRRKMAARAFLPSAAISTGPGWNYSKIEGRSESVSVDLEDFETLYTWTLGASLSLPLFNGGATWAGLEAARAAEVQAERQQESLLRQALQEVELSLSQEEQMELRYDASKTQRERAEQAWKSARDLYEGGAADYLQVQAALVTWLSAELNQLSAHRDLLGARVQLHQSLGTTWSEKQP